VKSLPIKRSAMPRSEHVRRAVQPSFKPRLVFARDDASGASKRPGEAVKLLIVEDDYLVATQMEATLMDAGFDVAVVSSAEDAVEAAAGSPVDLVLMDVRLAGRLDGVDAAIELFNRHGIRSIFATAHSDAATRKRAQPAEPMGWLQKPFTMSSLVEAVRSSLQFLDKKH
jgi:two-component system, response regulator PdtaR